MADGYLFCLRINPTAPDAAAVAADVYEGGGLAVEEPDRVFGYGRREERDRALRRLEAAFGPGRAWPELGPSVPGRAPPIGSASGP